MQFSIDHNKKYKKIAPYGAGTEEKQGQKAFYVTRLMDSQNIMLLEQIL